jgi:hypothetical protein
MSGIEITLFAKTGGPLTKRISLSQDGKLRSDGGACRMARGEAQRLCLAGLAEFATVIDRLESNKAIALGALRDGLPPQVKVTTKNKLNGHVVPDVIARTAHDIVYRGGRAALMLLDYDTKAMPAEIRSELQRLGGFWAALVTAIPGLQGAGRVARRSTSAGLYRTDTGERLPGSDGEHHFLALTDGSDIERALRTAHDRCWLAGLGWLMVGVSGQLLERSIVDRMVGAAERLVFEGAPVLDPPLVQDRELRRPQVCHGNAVDAAAAIPPLTIAETARLGELKAKAKQALASEAAKVRAAYIASRADELAKRTGITPQAAVHVIERQCEGTLLPAVVLPFDDEDFAGCTVGDVLADPTRFEGATLADPVEGVEYGHGCAKVMIAADGTPWIHSFAHGRAIYQLRYDAAAVRRLLEQAKDADVLDTLIRLDAQAEINEVELEDLIRYLKSRTGNSIPTMKRTVREAREQRAARQAHERRERRRAERNDLRPQIDVPAHDAEWVPQMQTLNDVLRQSASKWPPLRDVDRAATLVRKRSVPNTHALTSDDTNPSKEEDK